MGGEPRLHALTPSNELTRGWKHENDILKCSIEPPLRLLPSQKPFDSKELPFRFEH